MYNSVTTNTYDSTWKGRGRTPSTNTYDSTWKSTEISLYIVLLSPDKTLEQHIALSCFQCIAYVF